MSAEDFWFDTEPFLKAVYAFGGVLDGADPLDAVQVAVAINLPPEEVPWESSPEGTDWLANELVVVGRNQQRRRGDRGGARLAVQH